YAPTIPSSGQSSSHDERSSYSWSGGDRVYAGQRSDSVETKPRPSRRPPAAEKNFHSQEGEMAMAASGIPLEPVVFGPPQNPNLAGQEESAGGAEKGFFCRVCGERVTSLSEEKHNTSTLHIFNQQHRPQGRKVQIHESNKGFQLLAGMGWKLDEGLGSRKQGRVNPLQTTFKRNTTGLGAGEKLRPRVTHLPSHVPAQALNAPDGKSDAVRAYERLDRGRLGGGGGRRRRARDGGGCSGNRLDASGELSGVNAEPCARAGGGGAAGDSWGGFWGQGTHPGSGSGVSGGGGGCCSTGEGIASSGGAGRREGRGKSGHETGSFLTRREREAELERERRKERRTRFELLSDVPEEYAALFTG
ncbi:unnamed protein product, partial [Ectocarpus sp. 12 AP-2014]